MAAIQREILELKIKEENIGIITENSVDTYASIIAVLFSGYGFIPISIDHPTDRNEFIIKTAGIKMLFSSSSKNYFEDTVNINTKGIKNLLTDAKIIQRESTTNAYTIFTSGSTGHPKGVVISYKNINAFINAFFTYFNKLNEHDSFLQMFDLTFDASIMHYLPSLFVGGCTYTIPDGKIKYLSAYQVLRDFEISFSLMMPSTLGYLKPYFDSIHLPKLKYSLFGGEAVVNSMLCDWEKCVPNAKIFNAYGPTEASIFFLIYKWDSAKSSLEINNGLVPIGKELDNNKVILIDERNNLIEEPLKNGELCVSGPQVTEKGYIGAGEKNKTQFLYLSGHKNKFYKTGDIAYKNLLGNYMFIGRVDEQVQIDGYRVELSELEHKTRVFSNSGNTVALTKQNEYGNYSLFLFIEQPTAVLKDIKKQLKSLLPNYMQPEKIIEIEKLPLNNNNKFDKKKLLNLID